MPHGQQAPAPSAEGPTQHTQNQADTALYGLDPDQITMLREAIEEWRVGTDGKGHSSMEHWDVRRTLIRIFGIGGFDIIQVVPPEVVAVQEFKPDNSNAATKYTVTYRALCRLVIRNRRGQQLAVLEDGAIDEGLKQPSLTEAHDKGFKGAMSGALKRCAVSLGDQFGLSLYNKGSLVPVVYTPADRYRDMAVEAWDDYEEIARIHGMAKADQVLDQKVWNREESRMVSLARLLSARGLELRPRPAEVKEPQPATAEEPAAPATPSAPAQPERTAKAPAAKDPVEDALLAKLMKQTQDHWNRRDVLTQVRGEAEAKGLLARSVQGPDGKWTPFSLLLDTQIAALGQGGEQRSAA